MSASGPVWRRAGKKMLKVLIGPAMCMKTRQESQGMTTTCQAISLKINVLQGVYRYLWLVWVCTYLYWSVVGYP
jgi:hypothetical protein